MQDTENLDLKTQLQELVECPVCLKVPKSPIYQCKNGHVICDDCNKRVEECPTCRLPKENIRALLAEKLITAAGILIPCSFDIHGCTQKAKR